MLTIQRMQAEAAMAELSSPMLHVFLVVLQKLPWDLPEVNELLEVMQPIISRAVTQTYTLFLKLVTFLLCLRIAFNTSY